MNLSMWMLAEGLKKYQLKINIQNGEMLLKGVRITPPDVAVPMGDYVYVQPVSELSANSSLKEKYLLTNGKDSILVSGCSQTMLLNDILSTFEFYYSWEASLKKAASSHWSTQAILDISDEVLENPMLVVDQDGNILAMSRAYDANSQVTPYWRYMCENRKLPVGVINRKMMTQDGVATSDWSFEPKKFIKINPDDTPHIGVYVKVDEDAVAQFCLHEHKKELGPHDLQLTSIIAGVLSNASEFHSSQAQIRSRSSILVDLLDGKPLEEKELLKLTTNNNGQVTWQIVTFRNIVRTDELQKRIALQMLGKLDVQNISIIYRDLVVSLVEAKNISKFISGFNNSLNEHNYCIGISIPFTSVTGFSVYYNQAIFALDCSNMMPGVYYCKDFAFLHLLSCIKVHDKALELKHPALGELRRYDEAQHAHLYDTLYQYLKNERNLVNTSEALFIHRNTLMYRLKRIEELIGPILNSFEERMYILMSYWLDK